ncbi:MAG: TonB-dependent receptor [Acidobacteriaceae bacterium]|nr:TonB-dependent receptor [Acidobacteriaceae bacterium]
MKKLFTVFAAVMISCLLLTPLSAQVKSGAIMGTVTDSSGAVVPGAAVSVVNEETNLSAAAKTTGTGGYMVPYLSIGRYTLTVTATGFESYKKTGIVLTEGATVRADVALVIGSANSTVEVQANALALQTENATVRSSVGKQLIENLPNINGNPLYWATLQAGVIPNQNMMDSTRLGVGYSDRQAMSMFRINGTMMGSNDIQLNGLSVQGAAWHEMGVVPNPDSLEEVSVTTNTFTADMGMASGVISMTTKSGTNEFHGDLNYLFRNEALASNSYVNKYYMNYLRRGNPNLDLSQYRKGTYRVNEFGGAIGGPVIIPRLFNGRNKLFFFASYLHLSHENPEIEIAKVPTDVDPTTGSQGERNGDFSRTMVSQAGNAERIRLYNPWTATLYQGTTFERQPYANAIITDAALGGLNQFGKKLLNAYGHPNSPPTDMYGNNNYVFNDSYPETRDSLNARADYKLGEKQSIYFTAGYSKGSVAPKNIWGDNSPFVNMAWLSDVSDLNPYGALGDVITLNPTTVVEIRYGVTRIHTEANVPNGTATAVEYGMPSNAASVTTIPGAGATPYLWYQSNHDGPNWSTWWPLTASSWENKIEHQLNHAVNGGITKETGRWTLKAGGEYRVYLGNWQDPIWPTPNIGNQDQPTSTSQFSNVDGYTNTSMVPDQADKGLTGAIILTGVSGYDASGGTFIKMALAAKYGAIYTQDNWRPTKKLNLSLGLRYEVQPGPTERYNRMSSINLNVANPYGAGMATGMNPLAGQGILTFPGVDGYSRNLYQTEYGDISPRVGASYQLTSTMVIRGGFGRNYIPSNSGFNANGLIYGPSSFGTVLENNAYGITPTTGLPIGSFDQPQNTRVIVPSNAVQTPSIYGAPNMSVSFFDRYLYRNGLSDQWNLAVERSLGRDWMVSVGYAGSATQHLSWGGYPLNGWHNIPPAVMETYHAAWIASSGAGDPSSVQVPNPMPFMVGNASGDIGKTTISTAESQYNYLPFLGQTEVRSLGYSNYHSLIVKGQKSMSHGVFLQASYVWSKAMGFTNVGAAGVGGMASMEGQAGYSTGGPRSAVDWINVDNNYSLLSFDTPNRFVGMVLYDIPIGKGRLLDPHYRIARTIIGGWRASGAVTLQSGPPGGPGCGSLNGRCFPVAGQPNLLPKRLRKRYDGVETLPLPDGRTITPGQGTLMKYNPDRWVAPWATLANGKYSADGYVLGTTSMAEGDLRAPGYKNVNISLVRLFDLGERAKFEIHADATNAFNHSNIQSGNLSMSVSPITVTTVGGGAQIGQNANTSFGGTGLGFLQKRELTLTGKITF